MPKLTLRDLFAVVTIVALALGWWLEFRRRAVVEAENTRLVRQIDVLNTILAENGVKIMFGHGRRDQPSQSK